MKYLIVYDKYIASIAKSGSRVSGISSIYIIILPYFVPIFIVPALFEVFGWVGPVGLACKTAIIFLLVVGLFVSGFRFIYYANRRDGE